VFAFLQIFTIFAGVSVGNNPPLSLNIFGRLRTFSSDIKLRNFEYREETAA